MSPLGNRGHHDQDRSGVLSRYPTDIPEGNECEGEEEASQAKPTSTEDLEFAILGLRHCQPPPILLTTRLYGFGGTDQV